MVKTHRVVHHIKDKLLSHIKSLQDTQINAAKYLTTGPKQRKLDKITKVATKHLENPEFPNEEDIDEPPPSYISVSKRSIKSETSIYSKASISGKTPRSKAWKQKRNIWIEYKYTRKMPYTMHEIKEFIEISNYKSKWP